MVHPVLELEERRASAEVGVDGQAETLPVVVVHPVEPGRRGVGWMIGNLHFQIAVTANAVHAPDDPAIRQLLTREHVEFRPTLAVFRPLGGSHSHGHHSH